MFAWLSMVSFVPSDQLPPNPYVQLEKLLHHVDSSFSVF